MSAIQIGQGHVYHGRADHIRNSFRYPTYFLMFDCDLENELQTQLSRRFKKVLSLTATDYLDGADVPFKVAIETFLKERFQYKADRVQLHTLPRMFGYAFNPISFWFCHRDGRLDAVLCEVNNTFGEKHYYWLNPEHGVQSENWLEARKVFHVSPFLPVEGSYRFLFNITEHSAHINISYFKQSGELRLATWIQGDLKPIESISLGRLVLKYGWITPLVVLRIHFQALRLWWRGATFYRKPEPPLEEITQ